jgi:hypothetical protein
MAMESAQDALKELDDDAYRDLQRHRQGLQIERNLIQNPTVWPLLSANRRAQIIDGDFRGGAYPDRHQVDDCLLQLGHRRGPLWRALLALTKTRLSTHGLSMPAWVQALLDPPPVYDAYWVLSCPRSCQIREAMGWTPKGPYPAPDARQRAIDGDLWMWCNEGWFTTRYDLQLGRGRSPEEALGGRG